MYNPQNFWDISGAMIYQNNIADTADKKIEPPLVDANISDFSEITSDNTPDNFDTFCLSEISSIKDGLTTPPLGELPSVDNNSVQLESILITPMINQNSSITKTGRSEDKSSMTGSLIASLMGASLYMMETKGDNNKIEETEDLEWLEERAFAAEQSHEHTGGIKPDEDDKY
jgi:hypothetical protein